MKYVHSEVRKWACTDCNSQFKQRKNLRAHMLKVHNEDHIREDYQEKPELVEEYKCKECISIFKYKKIWMLMSETNMQVSYSFPVMIVNPPLATRKL